MAGIRLIDHPGVEIKEYDVSQVAQSFGMTQFLLMGFGAQGEDENPTVVTSMNSFLTQFGKPTTEAEKYFYYAAENILKEYGKVVAAKLPYANTAVGKYRATTFKLLPAEDLGAALYEPADETTSGAIARLFDPLLDGSVPVSEYGITPIVFDSDPASSLHLIPAVDLDQLRQTKAFPDGSNVGGGDDLTDETGIIINKARNNLNKDTHEDEVLGTFVVMLPAYNATAWQSLYVSDSDVNINTLTSPYEGWDVFKGVVNADGVESGFDSVSADRWDVLPTAGYNTESISKALGREFPTINAGYTTEYHRVTLLVCETYINTNNNDKIAVRVVEKFSGSLDPAAVTRTGKSDFIGDMINDGANASSYIEFYININHTKVADRRIPRSDTKSVYAITDTSAPLVPTAVAAPLLGFDEEESLRTIKYTDIVESMANIMQRVANIDDPMFELDVVVDAGLSTIAEYIYKHDNGELGEGIEFTPNIFNADYDVIANKFDLDRWKTVCSKLENFCSKTRKDCMAILDGPRNLVLIGNSTVTDPKQAEGTFDSRILPKLSWLSGINSSYAAMYTNWWRRIDDWTGNSIWLPPTCKVAGVYAHNDANANFWDAPAGLTRGKMGGETVQLSFNPTPKQADQLYLRQLNYAKHWPSDGPTIEGQKTLQTMASAFDRVNVRRLFLRLERAVYKVAKWFVYRPNNYYTRTQLIDILIPIFDNVKVAGGLFDYQLIADESNNGPQVVDNNELKLAVMLKPTRTAEYVLCSFYGLRTSMSFEEVVLQ